MGIWAARACQSASVTISHAHEATPRLEVRRTPGAIAMFDLRRACSGKRSMPVQMLEPNGKIPKVRELCHDQHLVGHVSVWGSASKPPAHILHKLGSANLVIGIDIETHNFVKRRNTRKVGQFGHVCRLHDDDLKQRIVQIGWAIGDVLPNSYPRRSGSLIVKPRDFAISLQATEHHGITNELALREGVELRHALEVLLGEVRNVVRQGGVVVAHNAEFDAGIIANELHNAKLDELRDEWSQIARSAVCTMDEEIMSWAMLSTVGEIEDQTSTNKLTFLGLKSAVELLIPKSPYVHELLSKKGNAQSDAQMHRLLYNTYRSLAGKAMSDRACSSVC